MRGGGGEDLDEYLRRDGIGTGKCEMRLRI